MEAPKTDSQKKQSSYIQVHIDCGCGQKYLVVDIARSDSQLKGHDRRLLKKTSKQVGRHFAESTDGFFTCPKCKGRVDLSNAGEEYVLTASSSADEVKSMMRRSI